MTAVTNPIAAILAARFGLRERGELVERLYRARGEFVHRDELVRACGLASCRVLAVSIVHLRRAGVGVRNHNYRGYALDDASLTLCRDALLDTAVAVTRALEIDRCCDAA